MTERDFFDSASLLAVVFATKYYNFDKFSKFNAFSKISKAIFGKEFADFWEFNDAQERVLKESLNKTEEFRARLFKAYDRLFKEGVLSSREIKELKSVFSVRAEKKSETKDTSNTQDLKEDNAGTFQEKLEILFDVLDEMIGINESEVGKSRLESVRKTLNERSFSIGVTGVMNAGKSTLLNALLRSNILGTAVVPETANLTLLKYSDKPRATVNFWNKEKWLEIERSGEFSPQIAKFTHSTKTKFKNKLDEFITDEGKKLDIDISELSLYTSAIKSDMICNLVQSVELYTDLNFLKDGVTIVDTPGLDDPVTKREEITKEYLSSCDLMMHLMNANQSATAKDVEFIVDALTYQGVSRLLIVITRIDAIGEEELREVINYTKNSVRAHLEKCGKGSIFGSILEKIEFIAVAGKLALLHRTGNADEALRLGYSEERTGIFEIERYLSQTLFGKDSPKANLLLASNAKILYLIIEECVKTFSKEMEDLNKTSDELRFELDNIKEENKKKEANIENLLSKVKSSANELRDFGDAILGELEGRAAALRDKIFSRVYDDVCYEINKNKKKPNEERISYIIQSGLKDGVVDIVRDFRFSFSKKSILAQEKLSAIFENVALGEDRFDVKAFFANRKESVNLDFSTTALRVLSALGRCSKSNLEKFAEEISYILIDEFAGVRKELFVILKELNAKLISDFAVKNEQPLKEARDKMREEIKRLSERIRTLDIYKQNAKNREETLREKLSVLSRLKDRLLNIGVIK